MGLRLRFEDGERAGEVLHFDDRVETIVIGRDPGKCRVVFPPGQTKVGREHCALKRVLGQYRLQLNKNHLVLVGGEPAMDDQELGELADLQLGPDGPKLVMETVQRSGLERTENQGVRIRARTTIVRDAERATRASRRMVIAAALLLLLAAGALYLALRKTHKELAHVKGREDRLREVLKRAASSAYMVLVRNADGDAVGRGTAWVVGDGVLATNAHVAEGFERLDEGDSLIVRSRGPEPRDFAVTGVRLHPGYKELSKIWSEYKPVHVYGRSTKQARAPGDACDVALLDVEVKEGLAEPLPLASDEELAQLDAGEPVGFVGYSMENLAAISMKLPNPTTQIGHITAVTDYFGTKAVGKEGRNLGHLVQHSLPAAGGASGSPILNAKGKVVAILSGVNVSVVLTKSVPGIIMRGDGSRVRLAADSGANFAQRADLLRELIEGRQVEAQAQRTKRWHSRIREIFDSGFELARNRLLARTVDSWEIELHKTGGDQFRFTSREVARFTGTLRASPPGNRLALVKEATLPGAGPCIVVAVAKRDTAIDLTVLEKSGPNAGKSHPGERFAPRVPWLNRVAIEVGGRTTVETTVSAADAGAEIDVFVYQAQKRAFTSEDLRGQLVALCREELKARTKRDSKAQAILEDRRQVTAKDKAATDRVEVALPAKGHYLAVAIPLGNEDIDLTVFELAGDRRERLGYDTKADRFARVCFEVSDRTKIEVVVQVSDASTETKFELHVYRMAPAGKE